MRNLQGQVSAAKNLVKWRSEKELKSFRYPKLLCFSSNYIPGPTRKSCYFHSKSDFPKSRKRAPGPK